MVRLSREFTRKAPHRLRRPLAHEEGGEPPCGLRIHGAGGTHAPDHEVHRRGHKPVTKGAVGPPHALGKDEEKLCLVAGADPVWEDVALQPLDVAEADASRLLHFVGEGLKAELIICWRLPGCCWMPVL